MVGEYIGQVSQLVVIAPLTALRMGDHFAVAHFPLHVTLLPPGEFVGSAELTRIVAEVADTKDSFDVRGTATALFGPHADIPVTLVRIEPARRLHLDLYRAVGKLGWLPRDPQYSGPGFIPHVTATVASSLAVGASLRVTELAVVEVGERATILSLHRLQNGSLSEGPRMIL
jgi:2'-5' RNA ligase